MPDRPVTLPLTEEQKTEETAPLQDPDDPLVQHTTVNGNHSHMDTSTIPITNGGTVENTDGIMEGEISQDDATLQDEVNATDAVAENANEHVNDEAGVTDPASSDAEPSSEQGALPETDQGSLGPLIEDPVPKDAASQMPDATSAAANNTDENGNLVLDPAAVAQGNVRALNGSWNTSAGLIDSKTGKRVSVKYDFKDGQGQAQVSRSDGVKCTTSTAGSAVSGALEIAGGNATCTDGGVVQLPKVRCVPSKNGKAQCSGSYDSSDGTSESVDMELYK